MIGGNWLRRARTWPWPVGRLAMIGFARGAMRGHEGRKRAEKWFLHEARVMPRGSLCIDLGANVGKYTGYLADAGHRVIAFEPDPDTFRILTAEVGAKPGVRLMQAAATTEAGSAQLYRNAEWTPDKPLERTQSSTLFRDHMRVDDAQAVEVEMVDFLAFLEGLGERVRLLKIDIEGGEVPLLEALFASPLLDRVDAIYCETHEIQLPELAERTAALRSQARRTFGPFINLRWH